MSFEPVSRLEGKVAAITGGTGAIGIATARRLAALGARCVLLHRGDAAAGQAKADGLPAVDPPHLALVADITDSASLRAAAAAVQQQCGRCDILVNSAGFTRPVAPGDLEGLTDELIDDILRANFRGVFATIRTFAPLLKASGDGLVVNISSIAGFTGSGSNLAYVAAKAGIDVVGDALAKALAPAVRVVSVSPGAVESTFVPGRGADFNEKMGQTTPLNRVGQPQDVAAAVEALATTLRFVTERASSSMAGGIYESAQTMNHKTLITCAVTGNLVKPEQTPHLPITPQQIADECLAAAEAGAGQVHIHVRDPQTGKPSMSVDHYRDVFDRIRKRNRDLIINLTTGPGGRFVPSEDDPKVYAPGTSLLPPDKRVEHIAAIRPDVCSLDLNTMNSGPDVVINTPRNVRKMAAAIRAAGVKPELEVFDSGDIHMGLDLISDGTLDGPGMWTFVLGVKYGFMPTPETVLYARGMLPPGAIWTAFGIGRMEFPFVAQAWLMGGHVRVGMEDNIYLEKGVLATSNAQLVAKARDIVEALGGEIADARAARAMLGLPEGRA